MKLWTVEFTGPSKEDRSVTYTFTATVMAEDKGDAMKVAFREWETSGFAECWLNVKELEHQSCAVVGSVLKPDGIGNGILIPVRKEPGAPEERMVDVEPPARKVEFLMVNEDGTWETTTDLVPGSVGEDGLVDWANEHLLTMGRWRDTIMVAVYNTDPEPAPDGSCKKCGDMEHDELQCPLMR